MKAFMYHLTEYLISLAALVIIEFLEVGYRKFTVVL